MRLDDYVLLCQKGSEMAFRVLYEETYSLVRYVIYTYVQNKHTIEDLVQETYMKAYEKMNTYEAKNFRNWIYTLAKNTAIDYLRKKKEDNNLEVDFVVDKSENPYLSYALYHLDSLEREVFRLKVLCGHTTKKIAEALALSVKKVNSLYYNAKKNLKKSLEEYSYEIERF